MLPEAIKSLAKHLLLFLSSLGAILLFALRHNLKSLLEPLTTAIWGRRHVRLTVHKAHFIESGRECYFINVTNLSRNREIEVTHVWFDTVHQVHALERDRPLPKRFKPDETWETWVDVGRIPSELGESVYRLGRARLSTGAIIKSRKNVDVPHAGDVPGGPVTSILDPRQK
jgi:hypothetical protein